MFSLIYVSCAFFTLWVGTARSATDSTGMIHHYTYTGESERVLLPPKAAFMLVSLFGAGTTPSANHSVERRGEHVQCLVTLGSVGAEVYVTLGNNGGASEITIRQSQEGKGGSIKASGGFVSIGAAPAPPGTNIDRGSSTDSISHGVDHGAQSALCRGYAYNSNSNTGSGRATLIFAVSVVESSLSWKLLITPPGVRALHLVAVGAQGDSDSTRSGEGGALVSTTLAVEPGQVYAALVGEGTERGIDDRVCGAGRSTIVKDPLDGGENNLLYAPGGRGCVAQNRSSAVDDGPTSITEIQDFSIGEGMLLAFYDVASIGVAAYVGSASRPAHRQMLPTDPSATMPCVLEVGVLCVPDPAFPVAQPVPQPIPLPVAPPPTQAPIPPTAPPIATPTFLPTYNPSYQPSFQPSFKPSAKPSAAPTFAPTFVPTLKPSAEPSEIPTFKPTANPTVSPTAMPTFKPTPTPTEAPTCVPTAAPTVIPTAVPTAAPSCIPTAKPTAAPEQRNIHGLATV
jgi:hypothetical protein